MTLWRARARLFVAHACAAALGAATLSAQSTTPDSTRRDSAQVSRPLEGVLVRAFRAADAAPIAQSTVSRTTIERRSFAQDVPLLLQGAVPSLTAHAETGTNWGYSYLRLRGLDQSRINLSLDGIPLNDPEDQVFYFANFADLASSVQSVQVQRGVGTSSAGTASFAGSINFETQPVAAMPRGASVELQGGSFGARRVMVEGRTGLLPGRVAAHARFSGLRTNGFRDNAGVQGLSGIASAAWMGDRDVVKATVLAGQLYDTLSYLAVPVDQLALDRRINPLTPEERDKFGQQLVSLAHTRQATAHTQVATTLYRMSASGAYDVAWDGTLTNYNLDHVWWGVTSAVTVDRPGLRLHAGINANRYARDHHAYARPDLVTPLYFNTGHKADVSGFLKGAWTRGRATWFGDLQARRARFRYEPDANAGFTGAAPARSWTFLNPRVGVTWAQDRRTELFASWGQTTREPTRSDLFAGADDLTREAFDDVGGFGRVRPERVSDWEAGVRWRGRTLRVEANAYAMEFRNEIARIGVLSPLGAELRSNVARSSRRGIEVDAQWQATASLRLSGNATVSRNRIAEWIDSSAFPVQRFRNVPPLLSPALLHTHRLDWRAARLVDLGLEGRYQGMSFLRND
ncbi:MAG: TonB-dependent receptor, partial [Gemmatimonadaceae bacterium]|nr:TonB-dependent receptor [Gemmatimonadaceae bacterium]